MKTPEERAAIIGLPFMDSGDQINSREEIAAAIREALEEAAKVADNARYFHTRKERYCCGATGKDIAKDIRALKREESK
jgi:hypothetical protein